MWDVLLRIFHWSLAAFFLLAYFVEADRLKLHSHAGYTVALLILFRLVWGAVGPSSARFAEFVVWPRESLRYFAGLLSGKAKSYYGHNPAGAAMVVVLLSSVSLTAVSGIVLFALEGSGPLANTFVLAWRGDLVERVHEFSANLSLLLVVVHIVGVLFSSFIYRENLAKAMITGRKRSKKEN